MTSGQDLITDMQDKLNMLNRAVNTLAKNGRALAEGERTYRVALAQLILKMRDAGMPVTIIGDVCRGDSFIADLKLARDTAQAVYDANIEAINVWKLQVRVLESNIGREWGRKD